jgi:hypothetical protein
MLNHTDPHGLCTLMWIVFCFFLSISMGGMKILSYQPFDVMKIH